MLKYRYYGEQLLLIIWEPSIISVKGNENVEGNMRAECQHGNVINLHFSRILILVLDAELQHKVSCTEFLDGWWS